jgi:hypothetical protein
MPLPMQGSWTVSVKSKEPGSTPQQFIISGATTGNGTYVGDTSTPPVHVTGSAWSIDVQHKPASSFVESFYQITFPVNNGTDYSFHVQVNDDDIDPVFDDLVLTCTTPVTQNDFIIYGNVSWYQGPCFFTPCNPIFSVVIDSEVTLQSALQRPAFNKVIQALYPERVYPKPIGPGPDPGPFKPFILPIEDNPIVPEQQIKVFTDTSGATSGATAGVSTGASTLASTTAATALSSQIATVNVPTARSAISLQAGDVANIVNPIFLCQSGALADYLLRFQDYTPTAAEAAGGPYTGTGARTTLGVTTTDRNGNYVFHFTLPCEPFFFARSLGHIHIPFPRCIVPLPNIIVQVLDGTAPSGVLYETTPFFNTPEYALINVCVPKGVVTLPPACATGYVIQSIGNITVGPPPSPSAGVPRTTSDTSLDINGIITSSSALGPAVSCAAWGGSLYFYACLDNADIVAYTIRFGRPSDADTAYQFVTEGYSPYRVVPAPVYVAPQSVGPTPRLLETEPLVFSNVPSYLNAETDTTTPWLERWKVLKMVLTSSAYSLALGGVGPVVFRIQGYNAAGNQLADERITLYIDNNVPDQFIDPNLALITTGGPVSQSNCALFTLPPGQPAAPIQISFRANQYEGFMASYTLYMDKGSTGGFAIQSITPGAPISDARSCSSFRGTIDEAAYGSPVVGELTAQVVPTPTASNPTGTWLAPGQIFCAFSINLSSGVWITDGQTVFGPFYATPDLIGIQQG